MMLTRHFKFMSPQKFHQANALVIQKRYLMTQKLLSMVMLVLKRLLFVSSWCTDKRRKMAEDEDYITPETRRLGYDMCRDSIGSVWGSITEQEFQIKTLSGGLTNKLYTCSLPDNVQTPDNVPRKVLLRVYGNIATECKIVVQNSVIFALMSEKQLGPKLYGMKPTARLEELIQASALATHQLQNPQLSRMIAQKLALFHTMDMPLCKEPKFLNEIMDEWTVQVRGILKRRHNNRDEPLMQRLRDYNLETELQTLKDILNKVKSPVVFSHNDLQEGNILYNDQLDENRQMIVIDWEYCSYNYRGYDLGNHFLEWTYNYNISTAPYFQHNMENYPNRKQQYDFFRAYLEASGSDVTDDKLEAMYVEANTFALASHFLWGLWSIVQSQVSDIEFGFLEYALCRFEGYFSMKENLP